MAVVFIIIIIIYVSVRGHFDLTMNNCKPVPDGVESIFEATLYTVNLSRCDMFPAERVLFILTPFPSEQTEQVCQLKLSTCVSNWNAKGCRCTKQTTYAYTFALKFTFQRSKHENSILQLTSDCVPKTGSNLLSQPCNLSEGNTRQISSVSVTLYPCLCVFSLSTVARMGAFENKSSKVTFRSVFTTSRNLCLFVRSYVAVSKAKLAENVHIVLSSPY